MESFVCLLEFTMGGVIGVEWIICYSSLRDSVDHALTGATDKTPSFRAALATFFRILYHHHKLSYLQSVFEIFITILVFAGNGKLYGIIKLPSK